MSDEDLDRPYTKPPILDRVDTVFGWLLLLVVGVPLVVIVGLVVLTNYWAFLLAGLCLVAWLRWKDSK